MTPEEKKAAIIDVLINNEAIKQVHFDKNGEHHFTCHKETRLERDKNDEKVIRKVETGKLIAAPGVYIEKSISREDFLSDKKADKK